MLNVLMFIFGSFWRWVGFTIILLIVAISIVDIAKVIGISIVGSIEAAHPVLTDDEDEDEEEPTEDSAEESSEEED